MDLEYISILLLKIYGILCLIIFIMVLLEFIDFKNLISWRKKIPNMKSDLGAAIKTSKKLNYDKINFRFNFEKGDMHFTRHEEGIHYVRSRLKQLERTMEEWGIEDPEKKLKGE